MGIASKSFALILVALFLTSLITLQPVTVKALSKTITVPDDYPTITSAIGSASSGDTVLVRSGTYLEHSIEINKTISLIGENAENTIIKNVDPLVPFKSSETSVTIMVGPSALTISADNVRISGFTITGAADENIYSSGSKTLIIGNNFPNSIHLAHGTYQTVAQNNAGSIESYDSPYSFIANNTLKGPKAGLTVYSSDNNVVYGNTIVNDKSTQSFIINVYQSRGVLIAKNNIANSHAAVVMSYCGNNTITANTVTNSFIALGERLSTSSPALGSGGGNTFYANKIANNSFATAFCGLGNTLYDNNFINNSKEIGSPTLLGGPNPSATNWYKNTQGNYWSEYLTKYPNATEVDGTGVGSIPYAIDTNNIDPYPLIAPFDTSTLSIQLPYWVNLSLGDHIPASSFPPSHLPSTPPSLSPTSTKIQATTKSGSTVNLIINGNIASSQMSQITIETNQSAKTTTLAFTVTGENGTTAFTNITIPKNAVSFGETPTMYIDGQPVQDQGYNHDANNYYVWYTTHFSTHEISIVFSSSSFQSPSPKPLPTQEPVPIVSVAAVSGAVAMIVAAGLLVYFKKHKCSLVKKS